MDIYFPTIWCIRPFLNLLQDCIFLQRMYICSPTLLMHSLVLITFDYSICVCYVTGFIYPQGFQKYLTIPSPKLSTELPTELTRVNLWVEESELCKIDFFFFFVSPKVNDHMLMLMWEFSCRQVSLTQLHPLPPHPIHHESYFIWWDIYYWMYPCVKLGT